MITMSKIRLAYYTMCVVGVVFFGALLYSWLGASIFVLIISIPVLALVYVIALPPLNKDDDKMTQEVIMFVIFFVGLVSEGLVLSTLFASSAAWTMPVAILAFFFACLVNSK